MEELCGILIRIFIHPILSLWEKTTLMSTSQQDAYLAVLAWEEILWHFEKNFHLSSNLCRRDREIHMFSKWEMISNQT
jgi:hypothetical protein